MCRAYFTLYILHYVMNNVVGAMVVSTTEVAICDAATMVLRDSRISANASV